MKFYWIKTPTLIKRLFNNLVWDLPNLENKIYLTFDDGPIPEITEWVLKVLKDNNVKATFFCVGDNINKFPDIFKKIIEDNHAIGNHTFNHLNGWEIATDKYIQNTIICFESQKEENINPKLFRPPYGKLKTSQSKKLRELGYKIIMWDILSADFDQSVSKEKCLQNVVENVKSGSIIVFHENIKAFKNLEYTLPKAIKALKEKGFVFDVIT